VQDNSFMHSAQKPGEGSDLTRQVLREFSGLHHQLTEVAGVKVRPGYLRLYRLCSWAGRF
jgi:hypothetical protein